MSGFRWPLLLLLPAFVIGALVLDQTRPEPASDAFSDARVASVMRPDDSASAAWFCVAGVPDPPDVNRDGEIPERSYVTGHTVTAINTSPAMRTLRIVAYGPESIDRVEPEATIIELRPGQREVFPTNEIGPTMIEVDGGGVLVEHQVTSEIGTDIRPCTTTSSDRWEFPGGETLQGTSQSIVIFNPFPEDAVARLEFAADIGRRTPLAFESVVIPGQSFRAFDVSSEVAQAETASATITVNAGRVIAERVIIRSKRDAGSGLTSSAGAPRAAIVNYLPVAQSKPERVTGVVLYNPNEERATVDVEVHIAELTLPPFEISIPALDRQVLDLSGAERMAELAEGELSYSVVVRSANGVPVASELTYVATTSEQAPVVEGMATMVGSSVASRRWLVDAPIESDRSAADSDLVLFNPSFQSIAVVSVTVIDNDGNQRTEDSIELRKGGRRTISFEALNIDASSTIVLESVGPIIAARQTTSLSSISMAMGVPDASQIMVETGGLGF